MTPACHDGKPVSGKPTGATAMTAARRPCNIEPGSNAPARVYQPATLGCSRFRGDGYAALLSDRSCHPRSQPGEAYARDSLNHSCGPDTAPRPTAPAQPGRNSALKGRDIRRRPSRSGPAVARVASKFFWPGLFVWIEQANRRSPSDQRSANDRSRCRSRRRGLPSSVSEPTRSTTPNTSLAPPCPSTSARVSAEVHSSLYPGRAAAGRSIGVVPTLYRGQP